MSGYMRYVNDETKKQAWNIDDIIQYEVMRRTEESPPKPHA